MKTPGSGLYLDSPAWPLLQAVVSYWGITDINGNALGTTLICSDLANEPSYVGLTVKVLSGDAAGQIRPIAIHNLATGTLTVPAAFTDNAGAIVQIVSGTIFAILSGGGIGAGGAAGIPTEGIYPHPSGVIEQIAFTIAIANPTELKGIYLDLVNLTQNADIRVYYQIDGVNYRVIETFNWTVGMDDGIYLREITVNHNVQITIQSTIAEGIARDIPYEYFLRE